MIPAADRARRRARSHRCVYNRADHSVAMHASTQILRNLAAALAALGFDPTLALTEAGVAWNDLQAADERRVPVDALTRFWSAAERITKDPCIGVRVGAHARLEMFGVLGCVAQASATLGDALLKTARYVKLWNEAVSLSLLVDEDQGQVWYRSLAPEPRHHCEGDAIMTILIVLSRELTGRHLVATEAHFAHSAPADQSPYRDVFGAEPSFDRGRYALVFPPDVLMLPIATHDSELGETLSRQVSQLVDALPAAASFARDVRRVLAAELRGGNPMIDNVAAQLGMHPKTLTRRLKQEGTSHSELLDSLRRDLAERYVTVSDLSVTEVAFLLGFSDASAFNKAFRRWFGVAPLAFRERTHA